MSSTTTWKCPTCRNIRRSAYCSRCGEQRLRSRDLTLRDLSGQFAKELSSVDGKLLRSLRSLLTTPGALSSAHVHGERRRFLGPLALFFIANALFVALQSATGMNILSSPLASHLHNQDWRFLAQDLVAHRLEARHETVASYAPIFDQAAIFNAKALMIVMALALVPVIGAIFYRRHRATGAHVVFSLHLYAFVILLLCFSLVLAQAQHVAGGNGLQSPMVDTSLSVFNLAACGIYIFLAIGPMYGAKGRSRIVQAVALSAAVGILFVGYRFGIFLITLYTT